MLLLYCVEVFVGQLSPIILFKEPLKAFYMGSKL